MLTHIHPSRLQFTLRDRPTFNGSVCPAQSPEPARVRQVPRAALPVQGVTSHCAMSYCIASEGITPLSSLILAHAPDQNPPPVFGCPSYRMSLQVAVSPCWELALPDIISTILAWLLGPIPRGVLSVHLPVPSRKASAFTYSGQFGTSDHSLQCNFNREGIFGAAVIALCSGPHAR
jgi:hypothetical protein